MDTAQELELAKANTLLAPFARETKTPSPERLDVMLAPGDLLAAVGALASARWGYLSTITGLDPGPATGELEALYHFCTGPAIVTLRVRIPRAAAVLPSVCGLVPYALLMEREMAEMFGIAIPGALDGEHLFLPEDWPPGEYPLRKDWTPARG